MAVLVRKRCLSRVCLCVSSVDFGAGGAVVMRGVKTADIWAGPNLPAVTRTCGLDNRRA
jgi:hypothetical protein